MNVKRIETLKDQATRGGRRNEYFGYVPVGGNFVVRRVTNFVFRRSFK